MRRMVRRAKNEIAMLALAYNAKHSHRLSSSRVNVFASGSVSFWQEESVSRRVRVGDRFSLQSLQIYFSIHARMCVCVSCVVCACMRAERARKCLNGVSSEL